MPRMKRFAAPFPLVVAAIVLTLAFIDPAWAQAEGPKRLNWFWSIFAGFVLGGLAMALFAWFFNISRVHWLIFLVLWIGITLLLRYNTNL